MLLAYEMNGKELLPDHGYPVGACGRRAGGGRGHTVPLDRLRWLGARFWATRQLGRRTAGQARGQAGVLLTYIFHMHITSARMPQWQRQVAVL